MADGGIEHSHGEYISLSPSLLDLYLTNIMNFNFLSAGYQHPGMDREKGGNVNVPHSWLFVGYRMESRNATLASFAHLGI
jgi:hypothetical protein